MAKDREGEEDIPGWLDCGSASHPSSVTRSGFIAQRTLHTLGAHALGFELHPQRGMRPCGRSWVASFTNYNKLVSNELKVTICLRSNFGRTVKYVISTQVCIQHITFVHKYTHDKLNNLVSTVKCYTNAIKHTKEKNHILCCRFIYKSTNT